MSHNIIAVENLSKRFVIRHRRNGDSGLRHVIEEALRDPWKWLLTRRRSHRNGQEEFWALKGISFDIKKGDVVGLIGRNGAGKSTLLKVLSRITEPTSGRIRIRGRVASLLEVGTGFHQELTGRENIFLNGAILGMSSSEIRRKLDEIVAFSEIDQFLDTPVKRYSSGMYVRLAFAVAAHLEPDILIVDEVLAVGDAQFQQKCLGKMDEVSKAQGRTILLVSHNMGAIRQLCSQVVLLERGSIAFQGGVHQGVSRYFAGSEEGKTGWKRQAPMPLKPGIYFQEIRIEDEGGRQSEHFTQSDKIRIIADLKSTGSFSRPQIALRFTNADGIPAFTTCNTDFAGRFEAFHAGSHRLSVEIPANVLMPGRYSLVFAAHIPGDCSFDVVDNQMSIEVASAASLATLFGDNRLGVMTPNFQWKKI